jgi:hypothetical protein
MNKLILASCIILSLSGCATPQYRPIVDTSIMPAGRNYADDLSECMQYSMQVAGIADKAAFGAIAGAIGGLLLNAANGGGNRGRFAAIGALGGAAEQGNAAIGDKQAITRRCLQGRGWIVLN